MKAKIGEFLLRRLSEIGVTHMFGVPGDFNLSFLEQVEDDKNINWVGTCNELNGSYAADAYGRAGKAPGVLLTTYGVGCLSAACGIAGAYSENVPLIHISGTPPMHATTNNTRLHHTMIDGGYRNVRRALDEFVVTTASITPASAVTEIDRAILACWHQRRPVRIELPSDLTHVEIEVPTTKLQLVNMKSSDAMLKGAVAEIVKLINDSKSPTLLLDYTALRYGVIDKLVKLAQKYQLPFAHSVVLNGNTPNDFEQYVGKYQGAGSSPAAKAAVESSDCVLAFGMNRSDVSTGYFSDKLLDLNVIHVYADFVRIGREGKKVFNAVDIGELVDALLADGSGLKVRPAFKGAPAKKPEPVKADASAKLTEKIFFSMLQQFIKEDDVVVSDTGTSSDNISPMFYPKGAQLVTQPLWCSIGYATGALLGTLLAYPNRRNVMCSGDGAFQLTAQEVSTMLRHKLKPVIFLINNGGYTIERSIMGAFRKYNDVQTWRYHKLPDTLDTTGAGQGFDCYTVEDLQKAMAAAEKGDKLTFIEVHTGPLDMADFIHKSGIQTQLYDYGVAGPPNEFTPKEG